MQNLFLKVALTLIIISIYAIVEAKEIMWAKCILNDTIKDCKLIDNEIYINGKLMQVSKVDVIKMNKTIYVLLKDTQWKNKN